MNDVDALFDEIPVPVITPAMRTQIEAAVRPSLHPVSPLPSLAVKSAQFFCVFVAIGVLKVAVFGTRAFEQMTAEVLAGQLAMTLGAALVLSISLAREMVPGRLRKLPQPLAVGMVFTAFAAAAVLVIPAQARRAFLADGLPCLVSGLLLTLPAVGLLWDLLRRGAPLPGRAFGLTLGAAAGLLGATVPNVPLSTCSHDIAGAHLLIFHGGVVLVAAIAGLVVIAVAQQTRAFRA